MARMSPCRCIDLNSATKAFYTVSTLDMTVVAYRMKCLCFSRMHRTDVPFRGHLHRSHFCLKNIRHRQWNAEKTQDAF